jgi:hypothetical protein
MISLNLSVLTFSQGVATGIMHLFSKIDCVGIVYRTGEIVNAFRAQQAVNSF